MSAGLPAAALEAIEARNRKIVVHVTRAVDFADIARTGSLLSPAARNVPPRHNWGSNDDLGRKLVCVAFMPSWGMIRAHFGSEESVLVAFDAQAVGRLPGAILCPVNSATRTARAYLEGSVPVDAELARKCLDNTRDSEMLVPHEIPLDLAHFVMFCDAHAAFRWLPAIREGIAASGVRLADSFDFVVNGALSRVRFPDDLAIVTRLPVRPGVDRRSAPSALSRRRPVIAPVSVADMEADLGGLQHEPDLFDELYSESGRPRDFADFVDWPVDDDEPLSDET